MTIGQPDGRRVTVPALVALLLLPWPAVTAAADLRLLDAALRPPEAPAVPAAARRDIAELLRASALAAGPIVARADGADEPPPPSGAADAGSTEDAAKQGDANKGEANKEKPAQKQGEKPAAAAPGSLDFDLLGAPTKPPAVDEGALRLRRSMLTWHQGVGLGMFALQLATTIVGQLSYDDKFLGDNTGKYVQPHAVLAFSTLAAFAAAGALALLAPSPLEKHEGFDRVALHKIAMFTAAAGMVAQGVIGVWTQSREGYLNQQSIGTAHLVIGYVTLAAVATGIGALVF